LGGRGAGGRIELMDIITQRTQYTDDLVKGFMSSAKLVFIRAIPGSGKTYTALAFAIWRALKGDRIAIFMRTKSEIDHSLSITAKISKELKQKGIKPPVIVPVGGKERLCRFPPENPSIIKWWCQLIRCEYLGRRKSSSLLSRIQESSPSTLKEYFVIAREERVCPYFAYQELCAESPIVIATHPYLVRDDLFERLGKRDILIIDEAHNLLKIVTSRIKIEDFHIARKIAEEFGDELGRGIIRLWRSNNKADASLLSLYENFIESSGYRIRIKDEYIKIQPPLRLIKQRLLNVRQIFLLSSTLYPINLYKALFARDIPSETRIIPGLFKSSKKRFYALLKLGLTSRFTDRSERVYRNYAKVVREIVRNIDRPTLIFAPSYEFAQNLARILNIRLLSDISEPLDTSVAISVIRGRLAEGIDITLGGEEPEILIVTGLPYPERNEESMKIIKFYSKYYQLDFPELLKLIEISEMLSGLIQASGRVGRRKRGAVIIIDDRLSALRLQIQEFTSLSQLIETLNKFFSKSLP